MDWVRGDPVGRGSFATVSLAFSKNSADKSFISPTAVKSCEVGASYWLKNEKHVLDRLGNTCPRIITCFGDDYTLENGRQYYNLFLEYASRGNLSDELDRRGGCIPELEVRHHVKSIVEGLIHIHNTGFAHCDIKLQNILMFENGQVKIADFGLAKETGEKQGNEKKNKCFECRGTPMFMPPELVNNGECESPADIWALGCTVIEMVTGKPAWNVAKDSNIWSLMLRIGTGEEVPCIPDKISKEGKDFLEKCFVKNPKKRWTAEMLLNHPFLASHTVSLKAGFMANNYSSPRSHFDFSDWVCSVLSSHERQSNFNFDSFSAVNRIQKLATEDRVRENWPESDGWTWTSIRGN
ncbi:mitogen-activated protein kinase kinase kinase 20 [Arachis duranensis]|uniref:Mitogen-activated protein kinase kinase kinase 20 n=1 Tax=Arachis duranensis TaxID=130453 RepID=A0A6P4CRB4_ARADU|nr:mitogen-activated protein kinase kinase kinase 20 [Arachis duranensis]